MLEYYDNLEAREHSFNILSTNFESYTKYKIDNIAKIRESGSSTTSASTILSQTQNTRRTYKCPSCHEAYDETDVFVFEQHLVALHGNYNDTRWEQNDRTLLFLS